MAGYLIINDDKDREEARYRMRNVMRGDGNYRYDGMRPYMRHEEDKMYEHGYRHGWEDAEDEHYRRARDSRGRYI